MACRISVASKCRPLKSSLDRRFSFSAIALRIMGRLRQRRCSCRPHPQRGVNAKTLRQPRPHSFIEDTPTARLIRQVLGAVAEFDKAMTVAKLRGARDRKRATGVKVEGRKSHAELRPEVVSETKRLYRRSPKTGERRSLREISAELAAMSISAAPAAPSRRLSSAMV